jgi:hypothetical protein
MDMATILPDPLAVFILFSETLGSAEGKEDPDGNDDPDGDAVPAETGLGVTTGAAVGASVGSTGAGVIIGASDSSTGESVGSTGAGVSATGAADGGAGIEDSQPQRSTRRLGRNGHWFGGIWPISPAV